MAGSRRIAGIAVAALMAACAAGEPGIDVPPPPPTEVREVVDTLHGVEISDPYRWLEDQEAPERQFLAQTRPLAQLDDCRVGRLQPPQTVRVGTQRRGEHSRVPPVVLRARRREAVAETVELFRVDRVDGEAALHQAFDHRPAWRLDRHSDFACVSRRERQHPARHLRQPCTAVLELSFSEHLPGSVEHAHLMFLRPPVDPREPSQLQFEPPLCRIEWARPDACRSLYWRSTAQTPHGASIGGWTAGAQVLFRCSLHMGPLGAPGGLPDSARSSREVIRKGTGTP